MSFYTRERWNFTGYIVSDQNALPFIVSDHHYASTPEAAAAAALNAGCDLEDANDNVTGVYNQLGVALDKVRNKWASREGEGKGQVMRLLRTPLLFILFLFICLHVAVFVFFYICRVAVSYCLTLSHSFTRTFPICLTAALTKSYPNTQHLQHVNTHSHLFTHLLTHSFTS